jgi:hypothetical protein
LRGAAGIAASTQLLHVEVESQPCIAAGQHLHPEVATLLAGWGFIELATSHRRTHPQFDAVYVRGGLSVPVRARVYFWLAIARARRICVDLIVALCPACVIRARRRWRARISAIPGPAS